MRMWTPDRAKPGVALIRFRNKWLEFRSPLSCRRAHAVSEVLPLLEWAERESATRYVVGWLGYEAAAAFDPAAQVHSMPSLLGDFAVYEPPTEFDSLGSAGPLNWSDWRWNDSDYYEKIRLIQSEIAAGRVYQVNFSAPVEGVGLGEVFPELVRAHTPRYGALWCGEDRQLASLSPELFFARDGEAITCEPMKGTRPASDPEGPHSLLSSPKERAENLMIVDLLRNDLGKVARVGSVHVPELFKVARHGSVWQMTSVVKATTDATTLELFRALFPCASVTGAPKIEAMKVIAELESGPRGVYCGAIGFMAPGKRAQFNVAIRTLERIGAQFRYGVGSGVVFDSQADAEHAECEAKIQALAPLRHEERWFETMRFSPEHGLVRRDAHLKRLAETSGAPVDLLRAAMMDREAILSEECLVRFEVGAQGTSPVISTRPVGEWPATLRAAIARFPLYSRDPRRFVKTTDRRELDAARAARPEFDEVLILNEHEAVCEFTWGNVVVEVGGELLTPPISVGLLPGILRAEALHSGEIREQEILLQDLSAADGIWHLSSARGWTPVELILSTED